MNCTRVYSAKLISCVDTLSVGVANLQRFATSGRGSLHVQQMADLKGAEHTGQGTK